MSLKEYVHNTGEYIRGVIVIGTDLVEQSDIHVYQDVGVRSVLYVEKNASAMKDLYDQTKFFAVDCLYMHYTQESFLQLWRENASYMNLDLYNMLSIRTDNPSEIFEGFGKLHDLFEFNIVHVTKNTKELETYLATKGFAMAMFSSGHTFYSKR